MWFNSVTSGFNVKPNCVVMMSKKFNKKRDKKRDLKGFNFRITSLTL